MITQMAAGIAPIPSHPRASEQCLRDLALRYAGQESVKRLQDDSHPARRRAARADSIVQRAFGSTERIEVGYRGQPQPFPAIRQAQIGQQI
jgi:hypothetical protein